MYTGDFLFRQSSTIIIETQVISYVYNQVSTKYEYIMLYNIGNLSNKNIVIGN